LAEVQFTSHLERFFPTLKPTTVQGGNVKEILIALDEIYPGIASYIVDESFELRQHVNIFIGENMIIDRVELSDKVNTNDDIFIMQALSGG